MKETLRTGILILILAGLVSNQGYGQREQITVNLSDPAAQGYLNFTNIKGSIKVTGYNGDVILITAVTRFPVESASKISGNKIFSADERNNRITIFRSETNKTIDFDLKIPRNFSMMVSSRDNGTIEIININGDIEASNPAGDIILENIAGSAVVSTVSGKITASFSKTAANSPMMFTSLEGNIELYLPEKTNARVKMRSQNGKLLSDFKIKPVIQPDVTGQGMDHRVIAYEGWTLGMINNGGPEYVISSYNGNIFLKKRRNAL